MSYSFKIKEEKRLYLELEILHHKNRMSEG